MSRYAMACIGSRRIPKALSIVAVAGSATSERWDMATPYPDANFHTRNRDVNAATNGELKITIHCNGSLFKHPDIKRSVRRGLVPIGETLISLLANEDPIYAVDLIPFLATSYEDAKKLWKASRGRIESALEKDGLKVLYAVPWTSAGSLYRQSGRWRRRSRGRQIPRLQPDHLAVRRIDRHGRNPGRGSGTPWSRSRPALSRR